MPGQIGSSTYGVCWNVKPSGEFDYLAGVHVAESAKLPSAYTRVALPAGRYAVVTHTARVSSLPQTFDKIWTQWIPASALTTAKAPCFGHYRENYDPNSALDPVEIWIPLDTCGRNRLLAANGEGIGSRVQ